MIRRLCAVAATAVVLLVPAPAQATFLPGTEPPVEYTCHAMTIRGGISDDCAADLQSTTASRTDLVGSAVVTTWGAELSFSGDGATTARSTATVDSTQVTAAAGLLRVQVVGARAEQRVACKPAGGNDFTGEVHIDRLVINGTAYTDVTSGEFRTPFGTVSVGVAQRDYYDSSFDALEAGTQTAVVVRSGLSTVTVARVGVMVYGFPC